MSDNVVTFKKPERPDVIWVCNCGCTSHYLHADGHTSCQGCNAATNEGGDWRAFKPPTPDKPEELGDDSFKVQSIDSAKAFLLKRSKEEDVGEIDIILVVYKDDTMSTFGQHTAASPEEQAHLTGIFARALTRFSGAAGL